jgi:hypothetical protein
VLAALGVGISSLTGFNIRVNRNLTGAVQTYGVTSEGAVQSDSTTAVNMFYTAPSTAAAAFTLGNLYHYRAVQGTIGAGSAITTQTGFLADSTLTSATTNYGFRGALPSASNRWNLYMDGTASNHLAGTVLIGTTSDNGTDKLQVTGSIAATGLIKDRITTIATGTTLSVNADTTDIVMHANTQTTGTLTVAAPSGTPINGQKLMIRMTSTNVQTFSWDAIFIGSTDLALPTASTGGGKVDYLGFMYNSTATKWQLVAKNFGF